MTVRITVYTVPNCAPCEAIKRFLRKRGVTYVEENERGDPTALAEMQEKANVRVAPVTVIGEQALFGTFEEQRPLIEAALRENKE